MKLSSYYKRKGEIVILAPTFSPEKNTKFFYRKDYDDGEYPINLLRATNVEYGGLAFSDNKYSPLPLEIERCRPDTSIYSKMEKEIVGRGEKNRKKIFQNMMTAEHCRLSLDGENIWEDYPKQFKLLQNARNLMLHDYDLGKIKGSFEEVKKILARARTDGWATRVGMKFPVQINNGQDLLNWTSLNSNSVFYSLRYDGVIEDNVFREWMNQCKERTIFSQIEYHVTSKEYGEEDFIVNMLPKILRQVIISRSYYVFFSLIYEDDFFTDKRWGQVLRLFNYYHNSYAGNPKAAYLKKVTDDTLFDFAAASEKVPKKYYGDVLSKDEIRDIFAFVREYHYPLFKDFYECSARTIGGLV